MQISVFDISQSRMIRSFRSSIFSFLRDLLNDFNSSYPNLYPPMPSRKKGFLFPTSLSALWLFILNCCAISLSLGFFLTFSLEDKAQSRRKQGMFLCHTQPTQLILNAWVLISCVKLALFLRLALWLVPRTLVGGPVNVLLVRILIFVGTLLACNVLISVFWFQGNQPLSHKQG